MSLHDLALLVGGAALAFGGSKKLASLERFSSALASYDPRGNTARFALLWAVGETAAGLSLMVAWDGRALPALLLIGAATGAISKRVSQGEKHDCGCSSGNRQVNPKAIVGNSVLLLALLSLAYLDSGTTIVRIGIAAILVSWLLGFFAVGGDTSQERQMSYPLEPDFKS